MYLVLNQHEDSISDFDQVIALDPDNSDAYYKRGVAKLKLSQHKLETKGRWGFHYRRHLDASIADFDQAIELNPGNADAYIFRGTAYHRRGVPGLDYRQAVSDFTEAIRIGGSANNLALAHYKRGVSYLHLGDWTRGDADKAKACSLDSQYC
jgi:tetratricopeptide (TPR) repeat protein